MLAGAMADGVTVEGGTLDGTPSLVMQVSSESAELPDERSYSASIALGERPRLLTARRHTPHCISDIVSN